MASCITSDPFVKNSKNWGTTFARLRTLRSCSKLMSDGGRLASSGSAECSPWRSMTHRSTRFFLARDRTGIKPLYYHCGPSGFLFGSELKAILRVPGVPRRLDYQAFADFLVLGYPLAPKTMFSDLSELEPGHGYAFLGRGLKSGGLVMASSSSLSGGISGFRTNPGGPHRKSTGAFGFGRTDWVLLSGGIDSSLLSPSLQKCLGKMWRLHCIIRRSRL